MRTFVPPGPGAEVSPDWGVRRAVRLAFPHPSALVGDPVHTGRLRVYLTDLLRPYGLGLDPGALEQGGQSYGEMAEALIRLAVPAGESVDLLVLAYAVPDITPGRATTTYLSHVCPGGPMTFAVSDQGSAGAFTALRLVREYARAGELRRALLLVVEQDSLPYHPGVPVQLPSGSSGVALLFGERLPGERPARIGRVATRQLPTEEGLAAELDALHAADGGSGGGAAPTAALLGAALAARVTAPAGTVRRGAADAGRPGTGVWWELAGELADGPAGAGPAPGRLLLADYDVGLRHLSLAAIELGDGAGDGAAATPVCVEDYRRLARLRIDAPVWDFIEGGAETERTVSANRRAFDRVTLRPRVLVDVSSCDTGTELLGARLATPVGVAPTAYHRLVHPDGEIGTARGAGAAGALYVVSLFASHTVEDIAAEADGPLWMQLYWLRRREVLAGLVERAAAAGCRAVLLTVDVPRLGRRRRDARNGFAIGPGVRAANLDPALTASAHRADAGRSALAVHTAEAVDPSVTWSDLAWLRKQSDLPLVLKGILTGQDAALAVEHGAEAIVVSNHGGRQLDGATATLDALAEVVDAVAGACPVLLDGGVRGGTDAFAALALGARAVLLGRPVLWGLAVGGAAGVADVLNLATDELAHTMALAGRPDLASVDRSAVVHRAAT